MGRYKKEVKRLIREQEKELKREKYCPRIYPEIIDHSKNPLLPKHKRFIIYGLHRVGFPVKTIAEYFKLSEHTVTYHIKRAKEILDT